MRLLTWDLLGECLLLCVVNVPTHQDVHSVLWDNRRHQDGGWRDQRCCDLKFTCWSQPWNNTHPEVGAEDVWVAVCHLKNAFDTLTKQLWSVHVFKDGLQIAHHHLKHTAGPIYCTSLQGFAASAITLLYTSMWCEMIWMIWQLVKNGPKCNKHPR